MEKIYIRPVSNRHYVPLALISEARMPKDAVKFLLKHRLHYSSVDNAIVATYQNELVGFFRYHSFNRNMMDACGTWVSSKFRRQGIATRMWQLARKKSGNKTFYVMSGSLAGDKFLTFISGNVKGIRYD